MVKMKLHSKIYVKRFFTTHGDQKMQHYTTLSRHNFVESISVTICVKHEMHFI